jgi:hypothetical protein
MVVLLIFGVCVSDMRYSQERDVAPVKPEIENQEESKQDVSYREDTRCLKSMM